MSSSKNINSVFYSETYHPIQAGSIDGTDVLPHDSAVYRALRCFNSGLYDPFGDQKIIGDPYCTLFVARLNHSTSEQTLRQAMSQYGRVKNLRLVRHIVTGASRGYAFVEFETEREMRRAYKDANHTYIDDSEILVDYNRQQLMPGWIPRRLGGGLGGKKESGQLRFGGRERPFRAPLRQIPYDDLKRLGISLPPEGRYVSRFEAPSPPRRKKVTMDGESDSYRTKEHRRSQRVDQSPSPEPSSSRRRSSENVKDRPDRNDKRSRHVHPQKRRSGSHDYTSDDSGSENEEDRFDEHHHRSSRQSYHHKRRPASHDYSSDEKGYSNRKDQSDKYHKSSRHSYHHRRRPTSHEYSSDDKASVERGRSHGHTYSHQHERWSPSRNSPSDE